MKVIEYDKDDDNKFRGFGIVSVVNVIINIEFLCPWVKKENDVTKKMLDTKELKKAERNRWK